MDFIAETCTLAPGDLILTGTPQGVGQAMDPPRFLQAGDVVRCEIEGLGAIEHRDRVRLASAITGEGPAVLLVHGFPDSRHVWREQVGPLAEAGFRVIAPDLRGFGESERPEGVDAYRVTEVVGDLIELLDEQGVERAHVVGHDWGAGIAWVLAALRPERVASLAALSVGHPNASRRPTLEAREKAWYQLLFLFDEAEELLLRDDARLLREWLHDAPDAERYVRELAEPGALTARLGLYRANLHPRGELQ